MIDIALIDAFHRGGIIAYPTEAVFGLGCDPDNLDAIERLLQVKNRTPNKGLILLGGDYAQLLDYVDDSALSQQQRAAVLARWPGAITQVLPAHQHLSTLLTGEHNTVAVRVTEHPLLVALCAKLNKPIISTSANISGQPHVNTWQQVEQIFGEQIDYLLKGETLGFTQPSTIINALTGVVLRA
jgi:L-threonylcarbamoyladenylate synthase